MTPSNNPSPPHSPIPNPKSPIRNIVFDLGGVLIDWNPRYYYRTIEADEAKIEQFLANVCHHEWNEQMDAGKSFAQAVEELLPHHPGHEEWIRAYAANWEKMLGGTIDGTVEILRELKERGRPLYALTNWSHETFPRARALYPFLGWFDGIVVSGEVKMIKPHPEIYHHLLTTHDLVAGESVFIDDRQPNIDAAEAAGFHGILFESPEQLRRDLVALGLL